MSTPKNFWKNQFDEGFECISFILSCPPPIKFKKSSKIYPGHDCVEYGNNQEIKNIVLKYIPEFKDNFNEEFK